MSVFDTIPLTGYMDQTPPRSVFDDLVPDAPYGQSFSNPNDPGQQYAQAAREVMASPQWQQMDNNERAAYLQNMQAVFMPDTSYISQYNQQSEDERFDDQMRRQNLAEALPPGVAAAGTGAWGGIGTAVEGVEEFAYAATGETFRPNLGSGAILERVGRARQMDQSVTGPTARFVGEAIGSALPYVVAALTAGGPGVVALGAAQGLGAASQSFEEAQAAGIDLTPEQRYARRGVGTMIGFTEAVPINRMLGRIDDATGGFVTKKLQKGGNRGLDYLLGVVEESVQETVQSAGEGVADEMILELERDIGQQAAEGAGGGAVAGGFMQAVFNAALKGKGRADIDLSRPVAPDKIKEPKRPADSLRSMSRDQLKRYAEQNIGMQDVTGTRTQILNRINDLFESPQTQEQPDAQEKETATQAPPETVQTAERPPVRPVETEAGQPGRGQGARAEQRRGIAYSVGEDLAQLDDTAFYAERKRRTDVIDTIESAENFPDNVTSEELKLVQDEYDAAEMEHFRRDTIRDVHPDDLMRRLFKEVDNVVNEGDIAHQRARMIVDEMERQGAYPSDELMQRAAQRGRDSVEVLAGKWRKAADLGLVKAPEGLSAQQPTTTAIERQAEAQPATVQVDDTEMFDESREQTGDEGGAISVEQLAKPLHFVRKWWQRHLTSRGNLPQPVFDRKVRTDSQINSTIREMTYTQRDFNKDMKSAYKKPTSEQIQHVNSVLAGESDADTLPENLRETVQRMRDHLDLLSRRLIESGAVEGDLALKVTDNLGHYLTRSYKAFDDPRWSRKVSEDVKNRAKSFIRKRSPGMTDEEVNGLIESLLYEGKAADTPIAVLSRGKLGGKDLSITKKRKAIAPEIRALWGEYKDAEVNYVRSVTKMAHLIENHLFLTDVREAGLGNFFHDKPIVRDGQEYKTRISAENNKRMQPLDGLYTTPEIKQAFEDALDATRIGNWGRRYMMVNGMVKYAKTVGSVMTHVRNFISNTGFMVANGHWNLKGAKSGVASVLADLGAMNSKKWRDRYKRYVELGVVHESARAGELRDVIKDATKQPVDDLTGWWARKLASRAAKVGEAVYRSEDDFWKIVGYESEYSRYRKALPPEVSDAEVEARAAENIRNTMPTYSLVPSGIKALRRAPLVGTFVSFPAEVVRVTGNSMRLALQELKNPQLRHIGAQRVAGLTLAATMTGAIATATRFLMGLDDDADEDLRRFVPPWSKNSQFAYVGRDEDGNLLYIDIGYTDPYNYLKNPLIAFSRGEDWEQSVMAAGQEAAEPFLGEEILAGAGFDIVRNKKGSSGAPVYNPQDSFNGRVRDILAHLGKTVEPGTVSSMRRIWRGLDGYVSPYGKKYDPKIEALATFTGHRVNAADISQSMQFRVRDYQKEYGNARRVLTSVLTRRGEVTDAELRDAYRQSDESMRKLLGQLHDDAQAAQRLGLTVQDVQDSMQLAGLPKKTIPLVINNQYQPYTPSNAMKSNAVNRVSEGDRNMPRYKWRQELNRRWALIDQLRRESIVAEKQAGPTR